jgi:hypothetical protein
MAKPDFPELYYESDNTFFDTPPVKIRLLNTLTGNLNVIVALNSVNDGSK